MSTTLNTGIRGAAPELHPTIGSIIGMCVTAGFTQVHGTKPTSPIFKLDQARVVINDVSRNQVTIQRNAKDEPAIEWFAVFTDAPPLLLCEAINEAMGFTGIAGVETP